jgi:hypothetical protein
MSRQVTQLAVDVMSRLAANLQSGNTLDTKPDSPQIARWLPSRYRYSKVGI